MMCLRASESTLRGMKVSKACRARFESELSASTRGDPFSCTRLTSFADSEELVDVPGDNSTGEPAPTPLENAAQGLSMLVPCAAARTWAQTYQWLRQTQFRGQAFAAELAGALVVGLEKVAHKVARGARVGRGAEGEQHEGHVQGWCG
jgi:hypothetical protein